MKKRIMQPYEKLATAIITQAAIDYLHLLEVIDETEEGEYKTKLEKKLEGVKSFFKSEWFFTLSDGVDGNWMIEYIEKKFAYLKSRNELWKLKNFFKLDDRSRSLHAMD